MCVKHVQADVILEGTSRPRGPVGPRRPPLRPEGGLGGGGALFSDAGDVDPGPGFYPTAPPMGPRRASWDNLRMPPQRPEPATGPEVVPTPLPPRASPPPPPGAIPVESYRAPLHHPFGPGSGTPMPPVTPYAYQPPEPFGQPPMPRRTVSFLPSGPMARPREDEERRGEPEAGAPPGRRDIQ